MLNLTDIFENYQKTGQVAVVDCGNQSQFNAVLSEAAKAGKASGKSMPLPIEMVGPMVYNFLPKSVSEVFDFIFIAIDKITAEVEPGKVIARLALQVFLKGENGPILMACYFLDRQPTQDE